MLDLHWKSVVLPKTNRACVRLSQVPLAPGENEYSSNILALSPIIVAIEARQAQPMAIELGVTRSHSSLPVFQCTSHKKKKRQLKVQIDLSKPILSLIRLQQVTFSTTTGHFILARSKPKPTSRPPSIQRPFRCSFQGTRINVRRRLPPAGAFTAS